MQRKYIHTKAVTYTLDASELQEAIRQYVGNKRIDSEDGMYGFANAESTIEILTAGCTLTNIYTQDTKEEV